MVKKDSGFWSRWMGLWFTVAIGAACGVSRSAYAQPVAMYSALPNLDRRIDVDIQNQPTPPVRRLANGSVVGNVVLCCVVLYCIVLYCIVLCCVVALVLMSLTVCGIRC